tara:strand:+ start:39253 stop:39720 length:468 start_codon:yes stop_codon:yes gene_type:complete
VSIFSAIGDMFGSVGDSADKLFTSDEERLKFRNELYALETQVVAKFIELEKHKMDLQSQIASASMKLAAAESASDSPFTRNYRPAIIVSMFLLMCANYMGFLEKDLPAVFVTIFGTSFGVIGGGRSVEKVVSKVVGKGKVVSQAMGAIIKEKISK